MKIDPSKKYKTTTAKHQTTIVSTDGPYPGFPVVGYVHSQGTPALCHWTEDGKYPANTHLDLVEDREPREWELVVAKGNQLYPDGYVSEERTRLKHVSDESLWEIVRVREIIEP